MLGSTLRPITDYGSKTNFYTRLEFCLLDFAHLYKTHTLHQKVSHYSSLALTNKG